MENRTVQSLNGIIVGLGLVHVGIVFRVLSGFLY